ncbi:MAG: bifunctional 2-polyprenyl-6-hydroxyphenol methylase/3-demethylubiquinol 3-O-methyltransferase UbiG [Rickettsiaceae bacterium]|nr:bifunctional 2-polyprenyl-6-hydroxyphenol methylase/3-demethylubiquinol 3-O-methyltransferase UbiG [Rickettsiaceae bacterium]
MNKSSIDYHEVQKFSNLSDQWWDKEGELHTLHEINPVRLMYINEKISENFPLLDKKVIKIIDIGSGGGLASEALARSGFDVTGIDASESNVTVAKAHAEKEGISVRYICTAAEDHQEKYDVVLSLEIIEHVADLALFMKAACGLLKKSGIIIASTINKTAFSYLEAIVAAEYLLKWVPKNTHDFSKFVKPSTLSALMRENDVEMLELKGLGFDIFTRNWKLRENINVNYFALGKRV